MMVANIFVAILGILAFGAGIFGFWYETHPDPTNNESNHDDEEN